ncbi:MAG: L-rhamnose mutarotase [Ilumatobacteraceae bacterium]
MTTTALHSVLREGMEAAYDTQHRTVWPELILALREAGITDWRIWRSGRDLFHLLETDDFDAAMSHLATSDVDARWQNFINTIVDHFEEGPDGRPMRFVWSLSGQANAATASSV